MSNHSTENGQIIVTETPSGNIFQPGTIEISPNSPEQKIRVLIVDDLKLMLEGLKAIFVEDRDIEIVGFAHNGKEAIEKIGKEQPDVVVLDLLMPVMGGAEATKKITKQFPEVKILILSSFEDDAIISEVLAAGANGYVLKNTVVEDLALAIRSVNSGSYHFAPGIMDNLAKAACKNLDPSSLNVVSQKVCTIESQIVPIKPEVGQGKIVKAKTAKTEIKKAKQPKPEKPLFPYGDWAMVIFGVIVLSQTDGMGHHLGHAGLFLLMLALIARPIRVWWAQPLKHRRAIGIFAFAATIAHGIYATINVLGGDFGQIFSMSAQYQWGMWAGIIALAVMTPAAFTSFQSLQRQLGKTWRKIHLLTVPALALAVLHTVLVGPHYMADFKMEIIDHLRTYGIIVLGLLTLLLRKRIFWSLLKLNEIGKGKLTKTQSQPKS